MMNISLTNVMSCFLVRSSLVARLRASLMIGSMVFFAVSLIVVHAKSMRDNRLAGRNGPCELYIVVVLT
jgi:hypothetical protein